MTEWISTAQMLPLMDIAVLGYCTNRPIPAGQGFSYLYLQIMWHRPTSDGTKWFTGLVPKKRENPDPVAAPQYWSRIDWPRHNQNVFYDYD